MSVCSINNDHVDCLTTWAHRISIVRPSLCIDAWSRAHTWLQITYNNKANRNRKQSTYDQSQTYLFSREPHNFFRRRVCVCECWIEAAIPAMLEGSEKITETRLHLVISLRVLKKYEIFSIIYKYIKYNGRKVAARIIYSYEFHLNCNYIAQNNNCNTARHWCCWCCCRPAYHVVRLL